MQSRHVRAERRFWSKPKATLEEEKMSTLLQRMPLKKGFSTLTETENKRKETSDHCGFSASARELSNTDYLTRSSWAGFPKKASNWTGRFWPIWQPITQKLLKQWLTLLSKVLKRLIEKAIPHRGSFFFVQFYNVDFLWTKSTINT